MSSKRELNNIIGQKFGRLTVIRRGKNNKNNMVMWWCKCDCGNPNLKLIEYANLKSGGTTSCGCYNRERFIESNRKYNIYDLSGEYGIGYTNKGEEFYFDLEDYNKIKDYYWFKTNYGYIATVTNVGNEVLMHRFILGLPKFNFDIEVDHIKHKRYDNRKSELRIVDKSKNQKNKVLQANNTSGVAGVNWNKSHGKWCARININEKRVELGYYSNFEDAVTVRKEAEEKYYKEYSYKNSMKLNITNKGDVKMGKMNRIKEITKILNDARNEYYNNSNNIMSDAEYDNLFDELSALETETGVILSNSPTQTVGYTVQSKLNKSTHEYPMLSLDKTKNGDDLIKFISNKDALFMFKLDGLTICNTYENGVLTKSETRGDGAIGEDITENAKVFSNLPLTIPYKGKLITFGEAIIDYDTFNNINSKLPEDERYKNPRNLCSGTVRQLDSKVCAERNVRFIAWRLVEGSESNSFKVRLEELNNYGFEVVQYVHFPSDKEELDNLIYTAKVAAESKGLPIDGLVVGFDNIKYGESLGMTNHHLKSQLAFKYSDDTVQTKMKYIDWTMGKTGVLTPTAVFQPCEIEGSTVERASLHNVSIFKEMCPTVGCTANVYKANCIIPQVKSFEEDGISDIDVYSIPKVCPICGEKTAIIKEKDTEVLVCTNSSCKGKLLGKLTHFVSKNAMNIDGLAEAQISQFIELGWLLQFEDIYTFPMRKEIMTLEGFGKRSFEKLSSAIEASRNTTLQRLIYSLSIPNVGKDASKKISQKCKGELRAFKYLINDCYNWTKIDGIGDVINQSIQDYFNNSDNKFYFMQLLEWISILPEESNVSVSSKSLDGKSFCITGSLVKYSNRDALVKDIETHNGKVVSGVTRKTDYLLTNDVSSGSSKNQKARELSIPVITEEQFMAMIK